MGTSDAVCPEFRTCRSCDVGFAWSVLGFLRSPHRGNRGGSREPSCLSAVGGANRFCQETLLRCHTYCRHSSSACNIGLVHVGAVLGCSFHHRSRDTTHHERYHCSNGFCQCHHGVFSDHVVPGWCSGAVSASNLCHFLFAMAGYHALCDYLHLRLSIRPERREWLVGGGLRNRVLRSHVHRFAKRLGSTGPIDASYEPTPSCTF
mmetsp:Transcript_22718/g.48227  ORF Transcript_22718/g.48227 Transcript_22718/m.48227 type:complete len:205 (+) Transcript_22718:189-803(+)